MNARSKPLFLALAAAVVLIAVGAGLALSSGGNGELSSAAVAPAAPLSTEPAERGAVPAEASALALDGPQLPSVQAPSTQGEIDFGSLRGPAVIHIYASWCSVCRAEAPGFSKALEAVPEVKPIFVAVEDQPQDSAAFAKSFGWPTGPMINDADRSVATKLGLTGQPNTILVDREGRTKTIVGGSSQAQLTAVLKALSA